MGKSENLSWPNCIFVEGVPFFQPPGSWPANLWLGGEGRRIRVAIAE